MEVTSPFFFKTVKTLYSRFALNAFKTGLSKIVLGMSILKVISHASSPPT